MGLYNSKPYRVDYLEIDYHRDSIDNCTPEIRRDFYRDVVNGIKFMLEEGSLEMMPFPDHLNASGVFKNPLNQYRREHPEMLFHSEPQIESDSFKKWFGDWQNDPVNASKVVDENGKPLVVEHGTHADFTEFSMDKIGSNSKDNGLFGAGFYFGTYAPGWLNDGVESYHVMKVYLDIKHPFEVNDHIHDMYDEIRDKMDSPAMRGLTLKGFNGKEIQVGELIDAIKAVDNLAKENPAFKEELMTKDKDLAFIHPNERERVWREHEIIDRVGVGNLALSWQSLINDQLNSFQFTAAAIQDGYDGVIVDRGEGYKEYVAFVSTQIKSATDNIGLFSKENPDIRYHFIGEQGAQNLDKTTGSNAMDMLQQAKMLHEAGASAKDIKIVKDEGSPRLIKGIYDLMKNYKQLEAPR